MKSFKNLQIVCTILALMSCSYTQSKAQTPITNKGKQLVKQTLNIVGDYEDLKLKKDVIYTYEYVSIDGRTDISTEKYLFDGELSYGKYDLHDRTLAELAGVIEQGYDGTEYWMRHSDTLVTDQSKLKKVKFARPTNFYWFAMFQKLMDPGLTYEFLEEESGEYSDYNVVRISFDSSIDKPTDIYQIYINKKTQLIDKFLFTVAEYGVFEIPLLMIVEYKSFDGVMVPAVRKYKESTWNAEVTDKPWTMVTWKNIKFDNGLTREDFKK